MILKVIVFFSLLLMYVAATCLEHVLTWKLQEAQLLQIKLLIVKVGVL